MQNNLFSTYLENNLQLGIGDLFEAISLRDGIDLCSYRYSLDAGLRNSFNPDVSDDVEYDFTKIDRHDLRSKTETTHYRYFYVGEDIVAIVYINIGYKNTNATLVAHSDYYDRIHDAMSAKFDTTNQMVVNLKINRDGNISEKKTRLLEREDERALDEFYPFLPGGSVDKFIEAYFASKATVLFFIGPPGTGKSTLLRRIIQNSKEQAFMIYDDDTKGSTEALDHFYESDGRILGVEDADKHLGKRTDGNASMAAYLNYTDGVIRDTNKKIVISTNLSGIKDVDEALLRGGRCFCVVEFRKLTPEEAIVARKAAGLSMEDFDASSKENWALSEVLNDEPFGATIIRSGGIGF